MDHDGLAAAGLVDHGLDLAGRPHVRPAYQADRDLLKLDQRRPHHPLGGVAGGIGNDKEGKHGVILFGCPKGAETRQPRAAP